MLFLTSLTSKGGLLVGCGVFAVAFVVSVVFWTLFTSWGAAGNVPGQVALIDNKPVTATPNLTPVSSEDLPVTPGDSQLPGSPGEETFAGTTLGEDPAQPSPSDDAFEKTAPADSPTPIPPTDDTFQEPMPGESPTPRPPFEGTFQGTIFGDAESSAAITLALKQDGQEVSGLTILDQGLIVNVGDGLCGGEQSFPGSTFRINGRTGANNPRHAETTASITVRKLRDFQVEVAVFADLSEDGQILTAQVDLSTLVFCRNPQLWATLKRTPEQ